MHFSRNPPGPNTSCIKDSVDSFAVLSEERCRATPTPVGPSSNCPSSRSAVFAARFAFAPGESPAGLNARFARNPPLLPGRTGETSYDNIPFGSDSCPPAERWDGRLLDSGHLRIEHPACVCPALALLGGVRSEEHTSELQSPCNLVCRLLLEKKNITEYVIAVYELVHIVAILFTLYLHKIS